MNEIEVQEYLYEKIPLTKLMGISINEFSNEKIELKTPLEINKNHKGTAFGGSLVTVLTTNCWLMAFKHFKDISPQCHIVIGKSEIEYKKPVTKDFLSTCKIINFEELEKSKEFFQKKGKTKINLDATIEENGVICVVFSGVFFIYN